MHAYACILGNQSCIHPRSNSDNSNRWPTAQHVAGAVESIVAPSEFHWRSRSSGGLREDIFATLQGRSSSRMLGFRSAAASLVEGFGENTKGMLQLVPFLFDHKEQFSGSRTGDDNMARARLSVKSSPNSMDFLLDTGHPLLNCTLDGVLKIGGVGAAHAATQEAYSWMRKGICTAGTEAGHNRSSSQIHSSPGEHVATTRRDIEKIVKKAGKEGLQWGMVAGMYAGLEYGMGKARGGKHDWKNAAVGGALTGVILSVSDGRISQDKMVRTALTASALATAAEFLKLL